MPNIANIDTPNFKTKELGFKNQLEKSKIEHQLQLSTTHNKHMKLSINEYEPNFDIYEVENLIEQNDGNNVNLDTQMSEMSKNSMMFTAVQSSIKKDSSWFKTMIDSASKN